MEDAVKALAQDIEMQNTDGTANKTAQEEPVGINSSEMPEPEAGSEAEVNAQ